MPNHVHGIIVLTDTSVILDDASVGAGLLRQPLADAKPASTTDVHRIRHGLPEIVRAFKTFSSRRINAFQGTTGTPFWQRNYYEHIIRNDEALNRIRQYIEDNPARWHEDPENPAVRGGRTDDLPHSTGSPNP